MKIIDVGRTMLNGFELKGEFDTMMATPIARLNTQIVEVVLALVSEVIAL